MRLVATRQRSLLVGVAWGLDEEATRQGVRLGIYEARGYENPQVQAQQLQNCQQRNADAYVIAAIDAQGLCTAIAQLVEQGKPVIDLVNGIACRYDRRCSDLYR